jgi:hypothetical protein
MNQVEETSIINDIRQISEFKGNTFSKHSKIEVRKALLINISKSKIESACHWCAELVCSAHFVEIWEIILFYLGKNIHLANPKLIIYIESRYMAFKSIVENGNVTNLLQLRNNTKIRKLFAEIICILSQSKTNHSLEAIKIDSEVDFNISNLTEILKAPSTQYSEPYFEKKDHKGIFIAINEFVYCLSCDKPNMKTACFWIEWIIEFEIFSKKRKDVFSCHKRTHIEVENCHQKDAIWLIWDIIIDFSKKKDDFIQKLSSSLLSLFCIKYTPSSCKKRRYLLYFAIELLIEDVPRNVDIFGNKDVLQSVIYQIDDIYKEIKKNEVAPNTDYLFNNIDNDKANNVEKTILKLEMMDKLNLN